MAVVGGRLAEHARDVQLVGGEVLGVDAHEAGVLAGAQGGYCQQWSIYQDIFCLFI